MPMVQETLPFMPEIAHAVLSECRRYRYVLYRSLDGLAWDAGERADGSDRRTVCFVLINPSVADENQNDPTIDKLIKYGAAWGYQRLSVVNVYAVIETDSKKISVKRALDENIIGDHNQAYRSDAMHDLLGPDGLNKPAFCFKKNLNGSPVHPLYQKDNAVLIPYERAAAP